MKIKLKYGTKTFQLSFPEKQPVTIYGPREMKGTTIPRELVRKALARPVSSKRLKEIAGPHHRAAIVVDDITRSSSAAELLIPVIEELNSAGVKDRNICVIVATGLHRKLTREELDKILGPLKSKIWITNHDPNRNLKFLGKTAFGTRVYLNKNFLEADIKVLTGDVEFHQFCGFGGGAKSVFPGLADTASILANHSRMVQEGAEAGRINGNPVRQEVDEVGRMAKVDFIVNAVFNGREEVVEVFCGNTDEAFIKATRLCEQIYCGSMPKKADVVIASAGGYPRDITLYQAQKAVESALRIVRKGGKIILLAECREGHGSQIYLDWMTSVTNIDEIFKRIKKNFVLGGHKAFQFARALKTAGVYLYSSLPADTVKKLYLQPLSSVQQINGLIKETDRVAVLPQAVLSLIRIKKTSFHKRRRRKPHRKNRESKSSTP